MGILFLVKARLLGVWGTLRASYNESALVGRMHAPVVPFDWFSTGQKGFHVKGVKFCQYSEADKKTVKFFDV